MKVLGASGECEMVACFLSGELTSDRFGAALRRALADAGIPEHIITEPDLTDETSNRARADLLGATRGYGRNRHLFDEDFPTPLSWNWVELLPRELARVRYVYYDYWNELSGGSCLAGDAADRIRAGHAVFGVSNLRFHTAAQVLADGAVFPPLILVGTQPRSLVCLEGNLRLTALALAGFPSSVPCLVAIDPALRRWTH